ncbi:MAG: hypothetical protein K2Q01_08325 [Rickettsiales bacterium]|nr:hypothetical protein [Rickettsiales bacterium]
METATQTATETAHRAVTPEMMESILGLTQHSIYLMGASFVLGSLFTLFLLLVLDFVRRGKGEY